MNLEKWDGKRYNSLNAHLKKKFGCKVYRVSIDAGFTCPNRDGTIAWGGCIYCGERGAASIGAEKKLSVKEQIGEGIKVMREKNKAQKFIAYFQAFTNTYSESSVLRRLYDEALSVDSVIGLAVSTRPDNLSPDILDLLEEYHEMTYLWLELGLQTIHDETLALINRGHSYSQFLEGYGMAKERGLNVCLHAIMGLPGENRDEIMATANALGELKPEGVKLHLMHALKGTKLAEMYRKGEWRPMTMEAYAVLVCDVLERISPETIVHRLTGDPLRGYLLAPAWSIRKWEVLNTIDAELERRGSRQGSVFEFGGMGVSRA